MRSDILDRIAAERARQIDLPGSELDVRNTPNEWAAIAAHYLTDEVRRGGYTPDRIDFENQMIKAAAVILAAIEFAPTMEELGYLRGSGEQVSSTFRETMAKLG